MKPLILNPREIMYTENMTDKESICGAQKIFESLRKGEIIRNPIYVVKFSEFERKYAIFNGNRRTFACELFNIPICGLQIESEHDFQLAQQREPTSWHRLEEEDFLKQEGEYFSKDFDALKKKGLLGSAYQRARKRIKEALTGVYN